MSPPNTSPLRLPMQARPIDRAGSRRAAVGGAGVEADNILDDIWGAVTDVVHFVEANPWVLAPLVLI